MSHKVLRYAAFAESRTGGNPAGVVLNARGLDESRMRMLAAEVGYSETAFLQPIAGRAYRIRYFSPRQEVAFCGHATIASAVALAERIGPGRVTLESPAGTIEVRTSGAHGQMVATLTSVPTHTRAARDEEVYAALDALGWQARELDPHYPAHVAYAGNDHLMLAAATRERLAAVDYDMPALADVMANFGWTTLHLFWAESPQLFHARDPFPIGGIREDPATGSAAAAFGGYLRDLGLVPVPCRITILQGEDMGRPSQLLVEIGGEDDRVEVTGRATPID